jgi:hypothetical protein
MTNIRLKSLQECSHLSLLCPDTDISETSRATGCQELALDIAPKAEHLSRNVGRVRDMRPSLCHGGQEEWMSISRRLGNAARHLTDSPFGSTLARP